MRRIIPLSLVALGALIGFAYLVLRPAPEEHERRDTDTRVTETPFVVDGTKAVPVEEPFIDDSEYELVHGILVRKDRDCTVRLHYIPGDDGTVSEAYSCVPDAQPEKHPYHGYTDETLLELSYADAKAAEILAIRLRDTDRELALSLAIRASALTGGDVAPIHLYSDAYPASSSIDGAPVPETIRVKYVLSAVSELLGGERNAYRYWRVRVLNSFENPDEVLTELNARAVQIVSEMQAIETEVKGESTIEPTGKLNDA